MNVHKPRERESCRESERDNSNGKTTKTHKKAQIFHHIAELVNGLWLAVDKRKKLRQNVHVSISQI